MVLVFCLYALLASTFTIGKMLLYYVPPMFLIAIRMIVAGTLLLGFYKFYFTEVCVKQIRDWAIFLFLSVVHITIPYISEFIALQHVAPSCAALVYNLSPLFTALFSYLVFKEKMTMQKWIGLGVGMFGILYFTEFNITCLGLSAVDMSYILLLLSVVSASFAWVVIRSLAQTYSPLFINGIAMLFGGLQSYALSVMFEPNTTLPWGYMYNFITLLLVIILVANILFYNLYGYLLKKYTATFLSFVGFMTPMFTALFDWLLLGQDVQPKFFVTLLIIGCGIYLFYKEELRQGYILS